MNEIGHPAHLHFFRRAMTLWTSKGHDLDDLRSGTKPPQVVQARAALCYFTIRNLGAKAVKVFGELINSSSIVSKSVAQGQALERKDKLDEFLL